jgi:hypothetical protein
LFAYSYGISVDPVTGEICLGEVKNSASNGLLYALDKGGKREYTITTGINSVKLALLCN